MTKKDAIERLKGAGIDANDAINEALRKCCDKDQCDEKCVEAFIQFLIAVAIKLNAMKYFKENFNDADVDNAVNEIKKEIIASPTQTSGGPGR